MPSDLNSLIFAISLTVFSVVLGYLMPEYRPVWIVLLLVSVAGMLYAVRSLYLPALIDLYRKAKVSHPYGTPISAALVVVATGILFFRGGWWLLEKNLPPAKDLLSFSAEVRSACVSDSGPLTLYMVTYPSLFGETASPVLYLTFMQVTNLQDVASTISEFRVAVSKEPEGPWEDLVPIPLATTSLYVLGKSPASPKVLALGRGTYRLGTPMTTNDMKNAALLLANPILESEFARPIQPHSPISGWVALDSLRHVGLTPGQIYFRVTIHDTANKGGKYVVPLPIRSPGESSMDVNTGTLQVTGVNADISSYHVKYYGAPFSR